MKKEKKDKEHKKSEQDAVMPQSQMKRLKKLFSVQSGNPSTAVDPNWLN